MFEIVSRPVWGIVFPGVFMPYWSLAALGGGWCFGAGSCVGVLKVLCPAAHRAAAHIRAWASVNSMPTLPHPIAMEAMTRMPKECQAMLAVLFETPFENASG